MTMASQAKLSKKKKKKTFTLDPLFLEELDLKGCDRSEKRCIHTLQTDSVPLFGHPQTDYPPTS